MQEWQIHFLRVVPGLKTPRFLKTFEANLILVSKWTFFSQFIEWSTIQNLALKRVRFYLAILLFSNDYDIRFVPQKSL